MLIPMQYSPYETAVHINWSFPNKTLKTSRNFVSSSFFRKSESSSCVPKHTASTVMITMIPVIIPNIDHPWRSPAPLFFVREKNKINGMITIPTRLAPMFDPIRANVEIFSRSPESNVREDISDQKLVSLNE